MDLGMYAFILATYFRMHPDNAKLSASPKADLVERLRYRASISLENAVVRILCNEAAAALEALRNDLQLSRLTSIELISEKTALRKECEQTCEHLNAKTLAVDALMDKLDKAQARCQELENELNDMRAKANRD